MITSTTPSAAIISIYDAANDSEGWNASLDTCVQYVGAHSANIMFHENDSNSGWRYSLGSQAWRALSPEQMTKTISFFEKYDAEAWAYVHKHAKQTVLIDTDYWSNTALLEGREDYRFFREELGFLRKAGSKLNDNLCWTDNIAFQFPSCQLKIPQKNIKRIQNLLPHAAKSIELWRTFSILKSQYKAVLSALDHVRVGLCIAEPSGTVIVANDEANRIFELSSLLRLGHDKLLYCRSERMQQDIRAAIQRVAATASGEASVSESFHVLGSGGQAKVSIEFSPLRDAAGELSAQFNGALVTLVDLTKELEVDSGKLAAAYKLSKAESDVCRLLINGTIAEDIADIRNVAPETVKSQIKNIYRKTGTRGRIHLTRLALKASPPVGH